MLCSTMSNLARRAPGAEGRKYINARKIHLMLRDAGRNQGLSPNLGVSTVTRSDAWSDHPMPMVRRRHHTELFSTP
jgi:hypothetical protein